jgi:hypothetical protein
MIRGREGSTGFDAHVYMRPMTVTGLDEAAA